MIDNFDFLNEFKFLGIKSFLLGRFLRARFKENRFFEAEGRNRYEEEMAGFSPFLIEMKRI